MLGIKHTLTAALAGSLVLLAGCRPGEDRKELRIGFLPNVTHAVPMVGGARGDFGAPGQPKVELVPFGAGPSAIEALLAGDVDLAYVGPGPAVNAFVRTHGKVRIVAGAASGGAALVVRGDLPWTEPEELARATLASPQIGNSQDIALRQYLWDHDLASRDRGGTVTVVPMSNADIFSMMRSKELDGAWVPEPWVTRLVYETGARVFVEESSLWPDGRYPTTLLVVSERSIKRRGPEVLRIARANVKIVQWINANPDEAMQLVNAELERHTGKRLPERTIAGAWKRIQFTDDPLPDALRENARAARRIGYLPRSDIRGILLEPEELGVQGPSWPDSAAKLRRRQEGASR